MPTIRPMEPLNEGELRSALDRTSGTSDMLPPREDDKVAGRIAAGFARGLAAKLSGGGYTPEPARFVSVPKSGLSTRPAAIVSLRDRVVLEALVERIRQRVEARLLPPDIVLWPRANAVPPKFSQLDELPLQQGGGYIVFGDVAGFYESVLHSQLRIELAESGVADELAEAIVNQLRLIMGSDRGLPQGVGSSDVLATLYLAKVDAALRAEGVVFWRHGDDYRIWAPTWADALRSAHAFEAALRRSGLLANSRKLRGMHFAKYADQRRDLERATDEFRGRIEAARAAALEEMSEEELGELVAEVGIDEDIQWRYFYHHAMTFEALRDLLAPSLAPGSMEVIEEMFRDVMSGKTALTSELRHARLVYCLRRMAAGKSTAALGDAGDLLRSYPDETQDVCNYLLSVVGDEPAAVAAACQYALTNTPYMTEWQRAWILRVLSRCIGHVSGALLTTLERDVESDAHGWLARIEAARVLAVAGRLSDATARNLNQRCGEALRADLVGVVAANEALLGWSGPFLEGAMAADPLARVVILAIRDKRP